MYLTKNLKQMKPKHSYSQRETQMAPLAPALIAKLGSALVYITLMVHGRSSPHK